MLTINPTENPNIYRNRSECAPAKISVIEGTIWMNHKYSTFCVLIVNFYKTICSFKMGIVLIKDKSCGNYNSIFFLKDVKITTRCSKAQKFTHKINKFSIKIRWV